MNGRPARWALYRMVLLPAAFLATGCVQATEAMPNNAAATAVFIAMETAVYAGVEATLAAREPPATPAPQAFAPAAPTPVCRLWLTAETDAALWAGPGHSYREIGRMPAGQSAEVIGRDPFYSWWAVSIDGRVVWVSSRLVMLSDCANYPDVAAAPPLP